MDFAAGLGLAHVDGNTCATGDSPPRLLIFNDGVSPPLTAGSLSVTGLMEFFPSGFKSRNSIVTKKSRTMLYRKRASFSVKCKLTPNFLQVT